MLVGRYLGTLCFLIKCFCKHKTALNNKAHKLKHKLIFKNVMETGLAGGARAEMGRLMSR